jgi:hypothetical protein
MVFCGAVVVVLVLAAAQSFGTLYVPEWVLAGICLGGSAYAVFCMYYLVRCPRCRYGLSHL